jgi:hypothetical protein
MSEAKGKSASGDQLEPVEELVDDDVAGRGRPARAGARRQQGGSVRSRILKSLKDVEEGDQLVEGTEVGYRQLEKFMGFLDRLGSTGRGAKLKEKIEDLLSPVEMEDGFLFDTEGVNRLVAFLEEQPANNGPGVRMGGQAKGRAGGWARGRGFGQMGQRQGAGAGMRGRRGRGAMGGQGVPDRRGKSADDIRQTLKELKEKVDKLSKPSE